MAKARDRTEDFKDAVRQSARSLGYDEAKLASILASFIIHKPPQRSPFTKAAYKTLESIGELDHFLLKHRKDYTDLHRTTEHERDSIENEVSAFIKTCQEQIDVLKNSINNEEENSKGWLGITTAKANADTIAHKHGVWRLQIKSDKHPKFGGRITKAGQRLDLTPYAWSEHVKLDYEIIETALGLLQNKIGVAVGTCSSVKTLNPKNLSSSACLCLNA
ncbi:syntaxin-81-like protein [Trifolium pratense]|uniref:Syntaxin-81-like protein n=1 Tax=Trifolium pratense TaxID=57577 RepID=A0A2K3MS70_TRIPR|nr:syntaxin-81-like protein [Trifolium pratense]